MSLDPNQQIAHDNVVSISSALSTLITNVNNGITALQACGASDSLAKVQALKAALEPVSQAVLDAGATYTEAGNI